MPIAPGLIDALRDYGLRSDKNKARLQQWQDDAIEQIGELKGGNLASASANGASFVLGMTGSKTNNMTNSEWFACLNTVLKQIELNYRGGGSRSYGRIQ